MRHDEQPTNGPEQRPPEDAGCSRRQWLAALGRWLTLLALAGIAALLLRRGGGASFRCRSGPCRACAALGRCRRPAAVEWKRVKS